MLYTYREIEPRDFLAALINNSMKDFLEKYPILAIAVLLWSMGIVTGVLVGTFVLATEVNAAMATIVTSVIGIPSVAFALYQARMEIRERYEERLEMERE